MVMTDVSVIIPLYNKGEHVGRALDSVFSQTYKDFEVVVVDDGSSDEGPDIVRKYNDTRLRLIQQDNFGPGAARNRGIRETTGHYVAFLDADDEWLPDFLKITLDHLNKKGSITIVLITHDIGVVNKHVSQVACLHQTLQYHGSHEEFCQSDIFKKMITEGHHVISHRH